MKTTWKRFIAVMLCLATMISIAPLNAFAAISETKENNAIKNAALLEELKNLYGKDAEEYYRVLEDYNLLDENGNIITDAKVNVDGIAMSLDEIEALLRTPNVDLNKVVDVDGVKLTLDNLNTMIEIERYLAQVEANLTSLQSALMNGITLMSAGFTGPSGVNHEAYVTLTLNKTSVNNIAGTINATVTLFDAADNQEVKATVKTVSGSAIAGTNFTGVNQTVTLTKQKPSQVVTINILKENADFTVTGTAGNYVRKDPWEGNKSFIVSLCDVKNARSSGATTHTVSINNTGVVFATTSLVPEMTEKTFHFYDMKNFPVSDKHDMSWSVLPNKWPVITKVKPTLLEYADYFDPRVMSYENEFTLTPMERYYLASGYYSNLVVDIEDVGDSLNDMAWGISEDNNLHHRDYSITTQGKYNNSNRQIETWLRLTPLFNQHAGGEEWQAGLISMPPENNIVSAFVPMVRWYHEASAYVTAGGNSILAVNRGFDTGRVAEDLAGKGVAIVPQAYGTMTLANLRLIGGVGGSFPKPDYDVNGGVFSGLIGTHPIKIIDLGTASLNSLVLQGKLTIAQKIGTYGYSYTFADYTDGVSYYIHSFFDVQQKFKENLLERTNFGGNTIDFGQRKIPESMDVSYLIPKFYGARTSVTLNDTTAPTVSRIIMSSDTFKTGEGVPITVEFSEPVKAAGVTLTVNGENIKYSPLEGSTTIGKKLTFLYNVKEVDGSSFVTASISGVKDYFGNALTGDSFNTAFLSATKPVFESVLPENTFSGTQATAKVNVDAANEVNVLDVSIDVSKVNTNYVWFKDAEQAGDEFKVKGMKMSLDGGATLIDLFIDASGKNIYSHQIPLPRNYEATGTDIAVEFYRVYDSAPKELILGLYASGKNPPMVLAEASDLVITIPSDAQKYFDVDGEKIFFQSGIPNITLGCEPLTNAATIFKDTKHLRWASTNEDVATISSTGQISFSGRAGSVSFKLIHDNKWHGDGATADDDKPDVFAETISITAEIGRDAFLNVIDNYSVTVFKNKPAQILWATNLLDKNGEDSTTFTVALYYYDDNSVNKVGEPVEIDDMPYTQTLTGNETDRVNSATIPEDILSEGSTGILPKYIAVVSSTFEEKEYSAYVPIIVRSEMVKVSLNRPDSLYMVDNEEIVISYALENWDELNGGDFDLSIVNSKGESVDSIVVNKGHEVPTETAIIPANHIAPNKNIPGSHREVYIVSVKAKNDGDNVWGTDSFVLYVYSANALELVYDDYLQNGANGTLMSNVPMIERLIAGAGSREAESKAIVALDREIALSSKLHINYDDYAWEQLRDQIAWKSSDSKVATVNYQQGTLYENIENFNIPAYAPNVEFILSGLNDGSAQITAKHVVTGDTETLNLTVETLRNKLYIFQFYPKDATTVKYTNGDGNDVEVTSDENGKLAVYEESGINSDIYCYSNSDDEALYMGTIYKNKLVSSEKDSTKLELYPLNILDLRRAAQTEIYFKNPDGTAYTGEITFRGGVYRNEEYASGAQFSLNSAVNPKNGVDGVKVNLGNDGKLMVNMNVNEFTTSSDNEPTSPGDRLEYIYELQFEAMTGAVPTYYPMLVTFNGQMNAKEVIATGGKILTLKGNTNLAVEPFISEQFISYSENGAKYPVNGNTSVGITDDLPEMWLETDIIWWGSPLPEDRDPAKVASSINITSAERTTFKGQKNEARIYPFSTFAVTKNQTLFNGENFKNVLVKGSSTSLKMEMKKDGSTIWRVDSLPFNLRNMLGITLVEKSPAVLNTIGSNSTLTSLGNSGTGGLQISDFLMGALENLIDNDADRNDTTNFALRLIPTEDATRYRGFISATAGNMSSDENVTGVYTVEPVGTVVAAGQRQDFDYLPNPKNVWDALHGNYLANQQKEIENLLKGKATRSFNFDVGGYCEVEIILNAATSKWEMHAIAGGFHLGGGVNYTWTVNGFLGPIPVTCSMTAGGTIEFAMDMQRGHYRTMTDEEKTAYDQHLSTAEKASFQPAGVIQTGNDYLNQLRVTLYMRAFAGVGFDISVVALKVGIYGQINIDLKSHWLTREYLRGDANSRNLSYNQKGDRQDDTYWGLNLTATGTVGIQFLAKFLFFSYETVFASAGTSIAYKTGNWTTMEELWAENKRINGSLITGRPTPDMPALIINEGAHIQSYAYLDEYDRSWGDTSIRLFALDASQSQVRNLQKNAYPYSDPLVTEDGQLLLYVSDGGEADISKTRVYSTARASAAHDFAEGTPVDNAIGYGDSYSKLAGTSSFAAAAWVRQANKIEVESGSTAPLSDAERLMQINSAEVWAGIYNGTKWTTTRLTENGSPDLAPVVATNGTQAIVAWRAVGISNPDNISEFDTQDAIFYKLYDGNKWGETQVLYDGTERNEVVRGIEIEMLESGESCVIYTVDEKPNKVDNTGWETRCAIIPADGSFEGLKVFHPTNDDIIDQNPQITTAKIDGKEHFIAGWHTTKLVYNEGAQSTENDVKMIAFTADGAFNAKMPDSIAQATAGTGILIGSNFKFAKNAADISDLTIVWAEAVQSADQTITDGVIPANSSVLNAVRFMSGNGGKLYLTGVSELAAMDNNVIIDHFDAFNSGSEVKSVILASEYKGATKKEVTITDEDGSNPEQAAVFISGMETKMYTASAAFTNSFELMALSYDFDEIRKNSDIQTSFTIRNSGKEPITAISFTPHGGTARVYSELSLMPNRSITLAGAIPTGAVIADVPYTIECTFGGGEIKTHSSTAYLDIPDVGVSRFEIASEGEGKREIQFSLYNQMAADIHSDDKVMFALYADNSYSEPVKIDDIPFVIEISNANNIALINDGGYSGQAQFDIETYVKEVLKFEEIPSGGITLYGKAWIERKAEDNQYYEIIEYWDINNYAQIYIDSLITRNEGKIITTTPTITNESDGATVLVNTQNNSLNPVKNIQVVASLLDANNRVIETKQYDSDINLNGEESRRLSFTFDQTGSNVLLSYRQVSQTTQEDDEPRSTSLESLSFYGVPVKLSDFMATEDAAVLETDVINIEAIETGLFLIAADADAAITVDGNPYTYGQQISLKSVSGKVTITVTVEEAAATYIFNYGTEAKSGNAGGNTGGNTGGNIIGNPSFAEEPSWPQLIKDVKETGGAIEFTGSRVDIPKDIAKRLLSETSGGITLSTGKGKITLGNEDIKVLSAHGEKDVSICFEELSDHGFKLSLLSGGIEFTGTLPHGILVDITVNNVKHYTVLKFNGKIIGRVRQTPTGISASIHSGGTISVVENKIAFNDCGKDHWAIKSVEYSAARELLLGVGNSWFEPEFSVSRAMVATVLYRLSGGKWDGSPSSFKDVESGMWYSDAIAWAEANKIVSGYGDGTFRPNDSMNREQCAVILFNFSGGGTGGSINDFIDGGLVSDWADKQICWAVDVGLIQGYDGKRLIPQDLLTRAQLATLFERYIQNGF